MKTATIHEIKQGLNNSNPNQLVELCLRLAKYKKENKELLAYLLFEAHDEPAYAGQVKAEIDSQFDGINKLGTYLAKKGLRKILQTANKHIRYIGSKQAEVELLIYYCKKLKESGIQMQAGAALFNLYQRQIEKINKALLALHEDLQHDYKNDIAYITEVQAKPAKKRWL